MKLFSSMTGLLWLSIAASLSILPSQLAAAPRTAQPSIVGTVKNFKVSPEFYPAPNNRQMKSLLEGAEATPQPDGRIVVRNARLQTFREDGRKELGVETPECTYDPALLSVSSPATLRAYTTDGKFAMDGTGFLWRQTNSSLAISNKVTTVLQPEMLAASRVAGEGTGPTIPTARRPQTIRIQSDRFDYEAGIGQGTYLGNVAVLGTNLALKAGVLRFQLPMEERQVQSITAEQDVVVDYETIHATGDRAVYTALDGEVRVTGQPTWAADTREGRARELIIDRTNQVFRAVGDAYVKIPGQGLQSFAFTSSNAAPASVASGDRTLEVWSDFYELRTNFVKFGDKVRLVDSAAGSPQGGMTCSRLEVAFAGTNQVERLTAEENVVITEKEFELRSARAEYRHETGMLLANGDPEWRAGTRRGAGEVISVDTRRQSMQVQGNASLRLPAQDLGQATGLPAGFGEQLQTVGPEAVAEIFSKDYTFQRERATFLGGVYISHPRMAWACETLTIDMGPDSTIQGILADESVAFDLLATEGQQIRGRAGRALYRYRVSGGQTNDLIHLTGSPLLETTNMVFQNSVFILDRAHHQLVAPGRYRLRGSAPGFDTNLMKLPDFKSLQEGRRKR